MKDYQLYADLIDEKEAVFRDRKLWPLLRSQALLNYRELGTIGEAIEFASKAVELSSANYGCLAHYSEVVAVAAEIGFEVPTSQLHQAMRMLDRAIAIRATDNPRFWVTRANLLTSIGDYDEALRWINRAIDLEPSYLPGYTILITDYQAVRLRVEAERKFKRLQTLLEKGASEAAELRGQIITTLGIFAAALALIITATQIAAQSPRPFGDASGILLIGNGAHLGTLCRLLCSSQLSFS